MYSPQEELQDICTRISVHLEKEFVSQEETEKLMAELRAWADAEYGRRADLARMLGVYRQQITDWLAGRKSPTLEQGLKIQAFLRKQRKSRR
jgi:DNA-binding XRE family transcriptional regulator